MQRMTESKASENRYYSPVFIQSRPNGRCCLLFNCVLPLWGCICPRHSSPDMRNSSKGETMRNSPKWHERKGSGPGWWSSPTVQNRNLRKWILELDHWFHNSEALLLWPLGISRWLNNERAFFFFFAIIFGIIVFYFPSWSAQVD